MRLENKVAIITGAGQGIGRVAALLFAREGARIVVAEWHEEQGQETVAMIKDIGGEATFIKTDARKEDQVRDLVKLTVDNYGKLDVLYNNAAVNLFTGAVTDVNEKELAFTIDINLKGPIFSCKYAIPEMQKSGGGSIINVGSTMALTGERVPADTPYAVSKGGMIALTRQIAVHFAKDQIRANIMCPGGILTESIQDALDDVNTRESIEGAMPPMGRLGEPLEVAQLALFLASDESSYITGTVIPIDGGYTAM